MPSVSPIERVGTYVSPEEWNELISDPETVRPLSFSKFSQEQSEILNEDLIC